MAVLVFQKRRQGLQESPKLSGIITKPVEYMQKKNSKHSFASKSLLTLLHHPAAFCRLLGLLYRQQILPPLFCKTPTVKKHRVQKSDG